GGDGNDSLDGGVGVDKLVGGAGDDTYTVDSPLDLIVEVAGQGSDTVNSTALSFVLAANVDNLVFTGTGNFIGTGNGDANSITGGSGNDTLNGLAGNDVLIGGAGNDILSGGNDNDTLIGGSGNDTMTGGAGSDLFVFDTLPPAADKIVDFAVGSDKVVLDDAIFTALSWNGTALSDGQFETVTGSAMDATQAGSRLIYNSTTGALYYDEDGSGTAFSSKLIVTLATHPLSFGANDIQMG
ncbi:MAG TPA: calcium-binding protein, partial [Rhodocyclaceae bacterium]